MKQILLSLTALALFTTSLRAQITLKPSQKYAVGDKSVYLNVDGSSLVPGPGGANRTWDFSNIPTTGDTLTTEMVDVTNTRYAKSYPASTVAEKNSDSTFNFMRVSGDSVSVLGNIDIRGRTDQRNTDPYTFIHFPLTYGDSVTDPMIRITNSSGQFTGTGYGRTLADGYGTLILGTQTHNNVLRLRMEQMYYDTISSTDPMTVHVISYAWYDNVRHFSLLKIDSVMVNSISYKSNTVAAKYELSEVRSGIAEAHETQQPLKAYVSGGNIVLQGSFDRQQPYSLRLYNLCGQELAVQHASAASDTICMPAGSLAPGVYIISATGNNDAVTCAVKLIIQ